MTAAGKYWGSIIALGVAHGFSDCTAGLILGAQAAAGGWAELSGYFLLYNLLAFGGQLPAGMLIDRFSDPRKAVSLALGLVAGGLLLLGPSPLLAILLIGSGSAVFHVAGGSIALLLWPGKARGAGIFAAPGVLGLALGGFVFAQQDDLQWVIVALLIGLVSLAALAWVLTVWTLMKSVSEISLLNFPSRMSSNTCFSSLVRSVGGCSAAGSASA